MLTLASMMPGMTRNRYISLIRAFVAVADTANMTAAANALHLTQGAVSQQVKRLEDAFGCSLFERDRRGLRLTLAGERLFGRAKRLPSLNDEIWAEMTTDAVEGGFGSAFLPDLVGTSLALVLKAYAEVFPRVELSLLCGPSPDLARALTARQLDLAIMEEPVGPSAGECLCVSGSSGPEPGPAPRI